MKRLGHIIAGIDFSPASKAALKTAIRIARGNNTPVTICHVMDDLVAGQIKRGYGYDDAHLNNYITNHVKEFMESSGILTDGVEIRPEYGRPAEALDRVCKELNAGLLVMGAQGTEHAPNKVGAVAAKCVRKVTTDVLLVREDAHGRFNHVLACVDFSDLSAHAVTLAAEFALFDRSPLDCLHVYASPLTLAMDYAGLLPTMQVDDVGQQKDYEKRLHEFVTPLLAGYPDLVHTQEVKAGQNIRDVIVEHVLQHHASLVVLGSHGHSALERFILGTTAETVVRHAPTSILVVKTPAFAQT